MTTMKRWLCSAACSTVLLGSTALLPSLPVLAASAEEEGNDTKEEANTLAPNEEIRAALASEDDVDWFKVTVPANGCGSISFTPNDTASTGGDSWNLNVYDASGEEKVIDQISFRANSTDRFTTTKFGINAGTYYICVKSNPDYYISKHYTVAFNYEETENWEVEPNNDLQHATHISCNKEITGSFTKSSDKEDWYQFTLSEPGRVSIDFNHDEGKGSQNFYNVSPLYGDGKTQLFPDLSSAANEKKTISTGTTGLKAGTYLVCVRKNDSYYDDNRLNYHLTVNYTSTGEWEQENNGSIDAAQSISLNKTYSGSLGTKDDVDFYKFNMSSTGAVDVCFSHEFTEDSSNVYWKVRLMRADSEQMLGLSKGNVTAQKSGEQLLGTAQLTGGNTYYLYIEKGDNDYNGGSYSFTLKSSATGVENSEGELRQKGEDWLYYDDGVFDSSKTGFIDWDGGRFLVSLGVLQKDKMGLCQDPNNTNIWYYLSNGQVMTWYTGLALYDGQWFYLNQGKMDTAFSGYVGYNGGLFLVGAGRIQREVSGLNQDPQSKVWYYLAEGQAQIQYTGLAEYDKHWFLIQNGRLAEGYNGTYKQDNKEYTIVAGMVKSEKTVK